MEDNKNVETEVTETETTETEVTENKAEKQPTMAEMQAQIQKLMVDNAKLKRAVDKNGSEAADYKRKWKESLSEVEQASLDKAEKEAKREEEFNAMKRELQVSKIEKTYLSMGYTPDEASRISIAEVDGDFDEKIKIQIEVDARKKKIYEAEFLKNRPDIHIGTGNTQITKEQFNKMGMIEKSKLKNENPEEYERLKSL